MAGAPEKVKNHAEKIMDLAMDMRDCVQFVPDPRPGASDHIKIRFACCSHIDFLYYFEVAHLDLRERLPSPDFEKI